MAVDISALGAWAIGVGGNIGSFAFLIHGAMIAQAGPLAAVLAWTVATVLALPLALVLAELASMFPSAGGPYYYKYFAMKRLLPRTGELVGFLTGWLFWIYIVAGFACMGDGFANLMSTTFFGATNNSPIWFGPLVIFALFGLSTVFNLLQVKYATRLNTMFTLFKLGIAVAFGVLAASAHGFSVQNALVASSPQGRTDLMANVMCVLPLAICGFSGIEFAGCTASETQNARKNVPLAIISCMMTVSLVYITLCWMVGCASPYTVAADGAMATITGTHVLATIPSLGGYIGGPVWNFIMTAGLISSIFSCGMAGLACQRPHQSVYG
jgi:amino acid transporter